LKLPKSKLLVCDFKFYHPGPGGESNRVLSMSAERGWSQVALACPESSMIELKLS